MADEKVQFPGNFPRMREKKDRFVGKCRGCDEATLNQISQDILRAIREESKRKYLPQARLIHNEDEFNNILRPVVCKQQISPTLQPYKTEAGLEEFAHKYFLEQKGDRQRFQKLKADAPHTYNPFETDYTNVYSDLLDAAVADSCDLFSSQRPIQKRAFREALSGAGEAEFARVLARMFPS